MPLDASQKERVEAWVREQIGFVPASEIEQRYAGHAQGERTALAADELVIGLLDGLLTPDQSQQVFQYMGESDDERSYGARHLQEQAYTRQTALDGWYGQGGGHFLRLGLLLADDQDAAYVQQQLDAAPFLITVMVLASDPDVLAIVRNTLEPMQHGDPIAAHVLRRIDMVDEMRAQLA